MQECQPPTAKWFGSPSLGALFVHLRLETAGAPPLLLDADTAQAACTVLAAQARMQRCRIHAIACGSRVLEVIVQFPASLPLHELARSARRESATAVARIITLERGCRMRADDVWTDPVHLGTLSGSDLPAAIESIRRQATPAQVADAQNPAALLTAEAHVV